jgi:hypothetical protein
VGAPVGGFRLAESGRGVGVVGERYGGAGHGTADEIRPERAGFDERDADAQGLEFLGEGFREAGEGGLRSAIGSEPRVVGDRGGGAHLDDVSGFPLAEVRQEGAQHGGGSEEVGLEGRAVFGIRRFLDGSNQAAAGVVDEDIDAAELGDRLLDEAGEGVLLGNVEGQDAQGVGDAGSEIVEGRGIAGCGNDEVALGEGDLSEGATETGRRTRDEPDARRSRRHGH